MVKKIPSGEPDEKKQGCLFCRIVSREIDAKIIFEDAISIAFLDIRPLFHGHCLLITKAHYQTIADLPPDLIGPFFLNVQLLAQTVQDAMHAEGTFLAINNTVSQSVPHFHLHVVPRRKGDGLRGFFWPRLKYDEPEILAVHQALSTRFKK
jgi:histidine triad (HIT) family protein